MRMKLDNGLSPKNSVWPQIGLDLEMCVIGTVEVDSRQSCRLAETCFHFHLLSTKPSQIKMLKPNNLDVFCLFFSPSSSFFFFYSWISCPISENISMVLYTLEGFQKKIL